MTDPAGSDTQIQYNDGGVFGASSNFIWTDDALVIEIEGGVTFIVGGDPDSEAGSYFSMEDYDGGHLVVSGGAVTARDEYDAGFAMANGTGTFSSGDVDPYIYASVIVAGDTGNVEVNATGASTSAFVVSGGSNVGGTAPAQMFIGSYAEDTGNISSINDVAFIIDTGPLAPDGPAAIRNSFSLSFVPSDDAVQVAQATLADAYGAQLFCNTGVANLYDWVTNFGGGGNSIQLGAAYPDDTFGVLVKDTADDYLTLYDGVATLSAGAGDDRVQIILAAGTGINTYGDIGFFGVTPVGQQPSTGALTSESIGTNATYMLQTVYDAMRAYGLLT